MDSKNLTARRKKLQRDLFADVERRIKEFHEETGLAVSRVDVEISKGSDGAGNTFYIPAWVTVDVEV